jgi:hypothetical protein
MKISDGYSPTNSYATLRGEKKDAASPLPEFKINDAKNIDETAVSAIDVRLSDHG